MTLQGSITALQDTVVRLYLELEHRFNENQLIRDLWSAMANDVAQQKRSMNALPPSFWNQLKSEKDGLLEMVSETTKNQIAEKKEDQSLRNCFELALLFEEPTTLEIYAPIIRKLRGNWTDQALDFYIIVKAHLARIASVTQSFSGDPILIQRSSLLVQRFEKEIQAPQAVPKPESHRIPVVLAGGKKQAAKPHKKVLAKQPPALAKHAKSHRERTKPLVEKINLQRRRVRR
jgi:hypothetical protein